MKNEIIIFENQDVKKELHELGKTVILTPKNKKVVAYDKERCICDFIRDRNSIDERTFAEAITVYFKSGDTDIERLKKYAEYMNISHRVKRYIDVDE